MGGALVAQHAKKSVAGAGALLTSTAGSTVTKWKADLELVESAEKGFKPTKSTYERESVAVLQRKRKSEVDDEENSGMCSPSFSMEECSLISPADCVQVTL